jgi:hypothetical protein
MNMANEFSMTVMDVIVLLSLLFTVVFVIAWAWSPNLRAWIEKPKYRFLADVENYDRSQTGGSE